MTRLAESLVIENPNSELLGRTLLGLGDLAERGERNDQAEQAYRAAAAAANAEVARLGARELVRLLRSLGQDDEADEITKTLPAATPHSSELLVHAESLMQRGRDGEAATISDDIDVDELTVTQRFRFVRLLRGLGQAEAGLDHLESLAKVDDPETRGRATFLLGEMYAVHEMHDEARAMFERSLEESASYWSEKSQIALGDLDYHQGDARSAGLRWALATASSVSAIAADARARIVDALDAPVMIEASVESGTAAVDGQTETTSAIDQPMHVQHAMSNEEFGAEIDSALSTVDFDVPIVSEGPVARAPDSTDDDLGNIAASGESDPVDKDPAGAAEDVADEATVVTVRLGDAVKSRERDVAEADSLDLVPVFSPAKIEIPEAEPMVVSLRREPEVLTDEVATEAEPEPTMGEVIDLRQVRDQAAANPYASLAPSAQHDDVSPSTRNPYEELAPNYSSTDPDPTEDLFRDWSDPDDDSFTELF
jgi:tetratricopeptide (TPR) repeat protein